MAKVILLHLSVIHSVHGGGAASVHVGIPPPPLGADTPLGPDTPSEQIPPEQNPPGNRPPPPEQTPPWEQTPPGPDTPHSRHPPGTRPPTPPGKQTPAYGLRAAGTHPTGMHSCFVINCWHSGLVSFSPYVFMTQLPPTRSFFLFICSLMSFNVEEVRMCLTD